MIRVRTWKNFMILDFLDAGKEHWWSADFYGRDAFEAATQYLRSIGYRPDTTKFVS